MGTVSGVLCIFWKSTQWKSIFNISRVNILHPSIHLGLTLATDNDEGEGGHSAPIFISDLQDGGIAERSKAINLNDTLIEVKYIQFHPATFYITL